MGEKYKLMWAARYLESTNQDAKALFQKIISNITQLVELFAEDAIRHFPDHYELSWMLLVDGCSLLQILDKGGDLVYSQEMNVKVDQLVLLWQDVLLLENQLPYFLLRLLTHDENGDLLKRIMTVKPPASF
ncbi:unnamed protein product [Sphenostylis stenocarpa]|uniref:Uncharacterized protein n=1 Tax=Sphenostylis stenocarpa TaxID=92480 RepID=A0AA86S8K7_9FABA|nr:unnamed protein product [Sphenostylis stenocarpa]